MLPIDVDDTQLNIIPSIEWAVMDDESSILNAMYGVSGEKELKEAVINICVSGLKTAISTMTLDDVNREGSPLEARVIDISAGDLSGYGVELRRLRINSAARSMGEMIRQSGQHSPGLGAVLLDSTAYESAGGGPEAN